MNLISSSILPVASIILVFTFSTFSAGDAAAVQTPDCGFNVTAETVQRCVDRIQAQPKVALELLEEIYTADNIGTEANRKGLAVCIMNAILLQTTNPRGVSRQKNAKRSALKGCLNGIVSSVLSGGLKHTTKSYLCLGYSMKSAYAHTQCFRYILE